MWYKVVAGLALALAVLGALFYSRSLASRAAVGQPAPSFTLQELEGGTLSLEDLAGKPVLLNFWATWCDPCREEAPVLQSFHERYGDRVTLVGVNLRESPREIRPFLAEFGVTYRNVLDRDGRVAEAYALRGVPESWIIDARGIARGHVAGQVTFEQLQRLYEQAAGEPADPQGVGPVEPGEELLDVGIAGSRLLAATTGGLWEREGVGGNLSRGWRKVEGVRGPVHALTAHAGGGATAWAGEGLFQQGADGRWRALGATPAPATEPGQGKGSLFQAGETIFSWVPGQGLLKRTGGQWVRIATNVNPETLWFRVAADPNRPGRFLAATPGGLLESRDSGSTWRPTGLERPIFGVAVPPGSPETVILAGNDGVYRSDDFGRTAARLQESPARRFTAVLALPGGTILAFAPNGDIVRLGDGARGLPGEGGDTP